MISPSPADPLNRRILAEAEDRIAGFYENPIGKIASCCGMPEHEVRERLLVMMRGGTIREIRQVLSSDARGASCLVAWRLPDDVLDAAFDWLVRNDSATGHIAIREPELMNVPSAAYRLWTTLSLPSHDADLSAYCHELAKHIGAVHFVCLPTVGMFRLSVGHIRRAQAAPGALEEREPEMRRPRAVQLTDSEKRVLSHLADPLEERELMDLRSPWCSRAQELGMTLEEYCATAKALAEEGTVRRFAVILDHTAAEVQTAAGTGAAALLMWHVPEGREEDAGRTCAQHICMTHCYWRRGTQSLGGAQIMGMVHAQDRAGVLAHKAAIDARLAQRGIALLGTQVMHTVRARVRSSLDIHKAGR